MAMTISEKDNIFHIGYENGDVELYPGDDFFGEVLPGLMLTGGKIFFNGLQLWGLSILHEFREMGLVDFTKNRLMSGSAKKPEKGEYQYILSGDNQAFYSISCTLKEKTLYIYESKNLIPLDDETILRDFETDDISVGMMRVLKEIRGLGVSGSTISSCAFSLWKSGFDRRDFEKRFPEPVKYEKFFRDSYHGGVCMTWGYGETGDGLVLDINSLYPFVMLTAPMPYGAGKHGFGEIPKNYVNHKNYTYFVRFRCRFHIKPGYIPWARTKCDRFHTSFEYLSGHEYVDSSGEVYDEIVTEDGEILPIYTEFCMYKTEFEYFKECYDIEDIEYIEYHVFNVCNRIFDNYINFFYEMKKTAKNPGERRISKMFMNALSGRLGLIKKRRSSYLDVNSWHNFEKGVGDPGAISAGSVECTSRSTTLVQLASVITSTAMVYIMRKAQENVEYFRYTDTDSLHLNCTIDQVKDIEISDEIGAFKIEHVFEEARYIKSKRYLTKEDGHWRVTFSGLPEAAKKELEKRLDDGFTTGTVNLPYTIYGVTDNKKIPYGVTYPVTI